MKSLNIKKQSSDCCLNQRTDLKSKSPHEFGRSDGFPGPLSQASLPLTRRTPAPSSSPPSNSSNTQGTHDKIHPTQSWLAGCLRHPNVRPGWWRGQSASIRGTAGVLCYIPAHTSFAALHSFQPPSERKERQVKSPTGSPISTLKPWGRPLRTAPRPRSCPACRQAVQPQGSPLPGPALGSASAFLSSPPPAAPGTLIRAASTGRGKQKETETGGEEER